MKRRLPKTLLTSAAPVLMCAASVLALNCAVAGGAEPPVPSFTLQAVIDLALTHNPTMEFGQGVIEEKEGDQISAAAYPNPSVELQGGHGRVLDPTGPSITERFISVSQPLEWPGTRAARKEAAEAGAQSAQARFQVAGLNVKADVKRNFYELFLAETSAKIASRLLQTVSNLERAVKRRVESGEAPPFELVKVNVELLQAQKFVRQAQGTVRANKAALNQLTAGHLGEHFTIQGGFASARGDLQEQQLIQEAFQHHPEIQQYQLLIAQASARHHQARQARVPDVVVSGTYQRVAGGEEFLGGLSVPLPIWNQRQGEIAKTLGVRRQAEANLRQRQILLKKGIAQQVQMYQTASAQIQTFEQGLLKQAKEAVRIARTSFKVGEASLLDVLDAQRVLWQTFQGYAQARFELSVALAELERLVGKEL